MQFKKSVTAIAYVLGVFSVSSFMSACNDVEAKVSPAENTKSVSSAVAEVNGVILTNADMNPYLLQGVDRAIAVDRAINKALAAELAEKEFRAESQAAMEAARRDVAAGIYLSKKSEQISKTLTDNEIAARYEILVKDADFNAYKVKVAIAATAQESEDLTKKSEERKFQLLGSGDGYVGKGDIPYNLGALVAKMNVGEYSKPIPTRNGFMVFHLIEVKKNEKPKLEEVKDQVRSAITQERVNDALKAAREVAKISLK